MKLPQQDHGDTDADYRKLEFTVLCTEGLTHNTGWYPLQLTLGIWHVDLCL